MKSIKETRFYRYWVNQSISMMDVKTIQLLLHHQFSFQQLKEYVTFPFTTLDEFASFLYKKEPELKKLLVNVISYETMCEFYLEYENLKQKFKKCITISLLYPCMLYLCSLATVMFLYHFFLPQVKLFTDKPPVLDELFVYLLYLIFWLVMILLLSLVMIHLHVLNNEFRNQLYIQSLSRVSFLQIHRISHLWFIIGFHYLMKTGVSTKQSLEVMLQFRRWPLVHQMAYQMLDLLKQGRSLEDALKQLSHSKLLTQYVIKGEIGHDLSMAFEEYISLETNLLLQSYQKSLMIIKLISYFIVIITLAVSDRIISIPLQHILNQF